MSKVATEAGLAFLGIDNDVNSIRAFYDSERIPVRTLAESIGIIIDDNGEGSYVQEVNGKTYLNPGMELSTEFDAALSIGAFLLYQSTPVELNNEQYSEVSLFAVTVIAPGAGDSIAESPSIGELIELSRKTMIPFTALKAAFK